MSSYIEKAFCRGVVPAGVPAFSHERRDQLVKMLGTSEKVRVITAPSGYGKSALSASFANTKQCFKDTVWVDCLSSCFIRDLSNNAMREMFAHVIDNIKLCVFDEVPHLPEREEGLFVELVNLLADNNIDVTINTPSEAKNFFLEKAYNFHLKPFDLLCEKSDPNSIPALVYSNGLERTVFESLKTHGLKTGELLLYYCMMILKKGTFRDLERFGNCRYVRKDLKFLKYAFPHLAIDMENFEFHAADFEVKDLKEGFSFAIYEIVRASKLKREANFFNALTDLLRKQGNFERAAQVAKVNLKTTERLKWGVVNTQSFSETNHSNEIIKCLKSTSQQVADMRDEVNASLCHTNFYLENFKEAENCANIILRSRKGMPHTKLYACIVALLSCDSEASFGYLETLLEISGSNGEEAFSSPPFPSFKFSRDDIELVQDFLITWYDDQVRGLVSLIQVIDEQCNSQEDDLRDVICVCANFVFRKLLSRKKKCTSLISAIKDMFPSSSDSSYISDLISSLVQFSFDCARELEGDPPASYEIIEACDSALLIGENLNADFLKFGDPLLFKYIALHRSQKREDQSKNKESKNYEVVSTVQGGNVLKESPNIKISFFGGFSIEVNGLPVQTNLSKRQNALYFLYLISKDLGREVTRDTLIEAVWRDKATSGSNQRNFYYVLSNLKKSFMNSIGNNLIQQNRAGVYIDSTSCSTDLQEFDETCKMINFDVKAVIGNMLEISEKIKHFSEPLLPQITKFGTFETIRFSYSERLIDSIIFAAMTLLERKDFKNALWFAKEAKTLDRRREDIYYLIMRAQSGLNLRSSAVNTFFECKNMLDEELGIKPSDEMRDLYQMVIS